MKAIIEGEDRIHIKRKRLQEFALTFLFSNLDEEVVASLLNVELEEVTEEVYMAVHDALFSLLPEER